MMTAPPNRSFDQGPLCKVCAKPMRKHSFQQQQNCLKEARKRGVDIC